MLGSNRNATGDIEKNLHNIVRESIDDSSPLVNMGALPATPDPTSQTLPAVRRCGSPLGRLRPSDLPDPYIGAALHEREV